MFVLGMLFLGTADITGAHFTGGAALTASATFGQLMSTLNSTLEDGGVDAVVPSGLFTVKNCVYVYFIFGFLWNNECINNKDSCKQSLPEKQRQQTLRSFGGFGPCSKEHSVELSSNNG